MITDIPVFSTENEEGFIFEKFVIRFDSFVALVEICNSKTSKYVKTAYVF